MGAMPFLLLAVSFQPLAPSLEIQALLLSTGETNLQNRSYNKAEKQSANQSQKSHPCPKHAQSQELGASS
jgi:hypothetical protein